MKITKSILSILLCAVIALTSLIPAFATIEALPDNEITSEAISDEAEDISSEKKTEKNNIDEKLYSELEKQWKNDEEAKRGITVNPGKDESERNFHWYMAEDVTAACVEVSENKDMSDAKAFEAEIIITYQGDKAAKATVTGLEENKTYYYTCVSGDNKSAVYSFDTDDSSFSALYMSDIHVYDNPEDSESLKNTSFAFAELLDKAQQNSDFNLILAGGDMATEGQRVEYEGLTFSEASRSLTFANVMGNHDRHSFDFKYFTNFPNEVFGPMSGYQSGNYYFVKGEVLFLVIDTNNASATAHRNLIKEAVKAHPEAKWRVVMMHHDLYGGSIPHREGECNLLRILFSPIFDEFHIDLVLMGHSHHYSVSDVIYNGKSVEKIENGKTVTNPAGTVYLVSTSVSRPEENAEINYSDLVSIGMEKLTDSYYNIIDFTHDSIKVTSYYLDSNEEYISFTLEKNDDYEPEKVGFFRKLGGILAAGLSTVYGIYVNADRYFSLKDNGYTGVGFFEYVF